MRHSQVCCNVADVAEKLFKTFTSLAIYSGDLAHETQGSARFRTDESGMVARNGGVRSMGSELSKTALDFAARESSDLRN